MSGGSGTHLRLEIADSIATVTIDRPQVRNALGRETLGELARIVEEVTHGGSARAIIVTGSGDRAFAAGADIAELCERRRDDALAAMASSVFSSLERFPGPTIAAINGHALGGGCELALACDLRIAAEHAMIGQPEVQLGIIPAAGGTQRLPRLIGLGRAKQMVLTGEPIDAPTALAWGLITAVVPAPELMTAAREWTGRILARGPVAIRLAKAALNASGRVDLETGLLIETLAQAICYETADKREGTAAFIDRRRATFTGR